MIVSVVIIGWLFLLFLLSDVILGFVISFGPLFIACYLFPFTRAFFDGWVRAVVAALLVKIFITALMTLFTVVMMTFVGTVTGTFSTTKGSGAVPGDIATEVVNLVALAAVCSLFGFVGFEMSKLAQSIAGGAHARFQKLPSLPRFGGDRESESSRSSGGGTQRQISGPASGAGAEPPPRQFAFDHTVGSADP